MNRLRDVAKRFDDLDRLDDTIDKIQTNNKTVFIVIAADTSYAEDDSERVLLFQYPSNSWRLITNNALLLTGHSLNSKFISSLLFNQCFFQNLYC